MCLSLALLAACAPLPARLVGTAVAPEIGDALLADWRAKTSEIQTLQGLARVQARTAQGSLNASQVIVAARPDRLRAETLSPFGSSLLVLAADGERLGVSLPANAVFYSGAASAENLGRFLRIPLRLEDLVDILLYRAPLSGYLERQTLALESGGWLVQLATADRRQELRFDEQRRLTELRYYNTAEKLFLEIVYGGFGASGALPQQIAIALPELETRASLDFEDVTYNGKPRAELFRLEPPAGAKVVSLDDL